MCAQETVGPSRYEVDGKMKKWNVLPCDWKAAEALAQRYQVPAAMGALLQTRGLTGPEQIEAMFGSEISLSDPMQMVDMDRAVERVWRAVNGFEKITVYGDYDADGVTSTAMLYSYLESNGADVTYYIPEREREGYGLNVAALDQLHQQGTQLIITVDNGISSVEEVAYAAQLGMDVVVTDHHRPREVLPAACAVVDPHRLDCPSPFKDFAGVGVAFKLIMALEGPDCDLTGLLENYADLVAIGTIGDVVPLLGENRVLIRAGLPHLSRSDRLGLRALLENASLDNRELTAANVAFGIVPRINATGRIASPDRAVRLLLSEDPEEAAGLAGDVCDCNDYRRQIESDIFERVLEELEKDPQRLYDRVLVVAGENWHPGVIGIVSARITERFGKPSILISVNGAEAKGSGRSIEGFSLFEAVCSCSDLLTKFGGHPMAAGLSLRPENIERFRERINAYAAAHTPQMPMPTLTIDCILQPEQLTLEVTRSVKLLEPFGTGNPAPLFGLFGVRLQDITPVGGGKHLRLTVVKGNYAVRCMRFGVSLEMFPYAAGDLLDLAVTLDAKPFNGKETLSIIVRDCKPSGMDGASVLTGVQVYEKWMRNESMTKQEVDSLTPTREEFANVYRFLRAKNGYEGPEEVLFYRTCASPGGNMGKLLTMLDVLSEHGLTSQQRSGGVCKLTLKPVQRKVNLFDSKILAGLRALQKEGEPYGGETQNL